jgi:hypothetical protein
MTLPSEASIPKTENWNGYRKSEIIQSANRISNLNSVHNLLEYQMKHKPEMKVLKMMESDVVNKLIDEEIEVLKKCLL